MLANFCKVKIIRNFLSLYKENCWEKLICNMAEYGIILLKKKKNISSMSSEDIINFVEDFKRTEGLLSPLNNIINHKINSHSKNKNSKKNLFENSFNKSITSNYSTKSSKSSNKKRGFSVKTKSKSKQKFLKRNESFSFNKSDKKNKKYKNKSFLNKDNIKYNNNNYMRIKIDSNRDYKNNNLIPNKNENIEAQPLKESFASLSSKDAFTPNIIKKNMNNNFLSNQKLNNVNNNTKKITKPKNPKKNLNSNNENYYNTSINNTYNNINNNNNIKRKKKKKNVGGKSKTIKVESKIKDLIQKDKNNFINTGGINTNNFNDLNNNQVYALPMNAIDELGSLRSNNDIPTKTSSDSLRLNIGGNKINNNFNNINNNINNNEINNININNNFNTNNNTNITTITSLEDKLNGLTLKLSKLNESINNNKKKLSAYSNMDQFPMYNNTNDLNQDLNEKEGNSPFINIGLGNTVLGNLNNLNDLENNNIKLNNGINKNIGLKHIEFNNKFDHDDLDENKITNANNNNLNNENDEDYLGEEQINL